MMAGMTNPSYCLDAWNAQGRAGLRFLVGCFLSVCFLLLGGRAFAQGTWQWVSGGAYTDVIFDGSRFVAVGPDGVVATSNDGATWSKRALTENWFAEAIAYNAGQYVVVGGLGQIFTSSDTLTWTPRTSGTTQWLFDVAYAGGKYVAVGRGGTVLTSPDGVVWTSRTSGVAVELWGVAGGGGAFAAVGVNGTLISSPDGVTWTARDSGTPVAISAVIHDGTRFVVQGPGVQARSTNGTTWTTLPSEASGYQAIAYAQGRYVTGGLFGSLSYSADNQNWTPVTPPRSDDITALAHGNGVWVAVGASGLILSSPDAGTWTARSNQGLDATFTDLVFAENVFVGAGLSGRLSRSTDGENWVRQNGAGGFPSLMGAGHGNGTFVVVGTSGTIWTSPDGSAWTSSVSGVTSQLNDVVLGNGVWCVVGDSGVVLTSTNLSSWTPRTSGTTANFTKVAHGEGVFVALAGTRLFTSPDGATWTERSHPGTSTLHDVLHADGRFFIAENNWLLVSDNGTSGWTAITDNIVLPRALAYGDGTWIAVGFLGAISYSTNGTTWTGIPSETRPTRQVLSAAAYGLDRFVATAQNYVFATPPGAGPVQILSFTRLAPTQFLLRWPAENGVLYDVFSSTTISAMAKRGDIVPVLKGSVYEAVVNDSPTVLRANFYQVRRR
jgi:hypothetical protein